MVLKESPVARNLLRRARQKRKTKSGQAGTLTNKYKFESILEFLIPHLGERKGLSNVPDEEDISDETQLNDSHQQNSTKESQDVNGIEPQESQVDHRPLSAKGKRKLEAKPQETASSQLMAYILAEKKKGFSILSKSTNLQELLENSNQQTNMVPPNNMSSDSTSLTTSTLSEGVVSYADFSKVHSTLQGRFNWRLTKGRGELIVSQLLHTDQALRAFTTAITWAEENSVSASELLTLKDFKKKC
ncbi:hypothetical protein J6590_081184 [Homalodisca vitripennis]|nr:hypothetical protein J6590_081184 [Homalodisca vitripennis]